MHASLKFCLAWTYFHVFIDWVAVLLPKNSLHLLVSFQLQPIFDDWDYLEDQHLLVSIKTADGMESYGKTCLNQFVVRD